MGDSEQGICNCCGKEGPVNRTYFRYEAIQCECHSPVHFEIIWHCNNCIPVEPAVTKIEIKSENLKKLINN